MIFTVFLFLNFVFSSSNILPPYEEQLEIQKAIKSRDVNKCLKLNLSPEFETYRARCIYLIAYKTKDVTKCDVIKDKLKLSTCYGGVANAICETFKNEHKHYYQGCQLASITMTKNSGEMVDYFDKEIPKPVNQGTSVYNPPHNKPNWKDSKGNKINIDKAGKIINEENDKASDKAKDK